METERIHNLTEQEYLVQRTCFMHSDNNFSKRSSFDPEPEDLFDKFSSSKAVQVEEQECSKRPLVIDRDLAVPFKKRKQLLEESDSCDVSTHQNLQKSDDNEGINVTFCQKFEKENFHESTPNTSQKAYKEGQIEFNLQSSVFVKADDSTEWIKLKCFDSIALDGSNSATFFAGGPIQSSAFCITPHDLKVNQYVALAVSNVIYNKHSYTNTKNMGGIIQFWNLGSLHERKSLYQLPSMELALYHGNGMITEMKWCPADCYDKCPSTCHLPRLGSLAVSSSDSCVYIYDIPQPDFMPKLKPTFPIYLTQPSMKLTPLFGEPSNVTRKAITTCVDWEKNGERIVAGYGNGAICVWMIKVPLFTSSIGVKSVDQSYIIQPYLIFQPSGASISSLSFAPFSNHRWLVVLSLDGFVRFFDLLDTSTPFKILKQGLINSFIWGEGFCGIYSTPTLNNECLVSLSATDCCAESSKKLSKIFQNTGIFDSSTHVTASGNGKFHAIADMSGEVTVNFLNNICKPLETSYLPYMFLETEIVTLDSVDLEIKTSQSAINISGNILSNKISSVNDTKGPFYTNVKQESSSSSSSSSGFCSPKHGKTIVIEMAQCFEDDKVNLLKSLPGSTALNNFKDIHNDGIKAFVNKPLSSGEETNDEMIKCSEFSEDLMRDLLMVKVSNQSKSSSHILPINSSNNSAYCDSKGAKHLSGGALITSAASDDTGDTIIYPLEDYFCDTSHSNALNSVESNAHSKSLGLNEKRNALHETTMHKINGKPTLESEFFSENSLNFSCSEVKSGNSRSNENSSSKHWCKPNTENCHLNYENKNLGKIDDFSSDHSLSFICSNSFGSNDYRLASKHSNIHKEEYHGSKKSPKEIRTNGDTFFKNLNLISKKDATNLSLHKKFDDPLCDVLRPNNLNLPEPLPDMYSSTTSNDFIICDRDDQTLSVRALSHSPAASDYSGDTIVYSNESHSYNDLKYLNSKKPGAITRSLHNRQQENTFQDISLHKMEEKAVLHGSKTKLLTENSEHFLAKKSLKCNSEYESDSATESCSLSEEDKNFDQKDILISNFHLLHSEYLCDGSEEKHIVLNELPQSVKDPQKLSYDNLISSFGVIFKNSLDKSANPLTSQKNSIYVESNPLSVIKTMSWDPNKGCQSWLFVGGNSGIGRLVFVPDFLEDTKKKPESRNKRKRN